MAPGSRSRTPSLRRQSQPVYPLPMIVEDVAAVGAGATDPPTVPERSPRRTRPASVLVLPSQYGGGAGGLIRNNSTGSMASIRAASERGLSSSYPNSIVGGGGRLAVPDGAVKSEAPRRQDPERHRIMDRMAKQGGWYKLVLLSILLVGAIVGLGVGLTLGLKKRNDRSPPPALLVDLFPAGLYVFTTALTNISTGCLPSAYPTDVWQCLTGNTFGSSPPSSPELSSTTYHWIIEPTSPFSYVISSSPPPGENNSSSLDQGVPALPRFTNLSLTLHDANQATERFTFSFTVPKSVKLDMPLTSPSNSSSRGRSTEIELDTRRLSRRQDQQEKKRPVTCFFNTTLMSATIWTRMRADFPGNIGEVPIPVNASRTGFAPWPFRIEVEEVDSEGGKTPSSPSDEVEKANATVTPDCRDADGKAVALSELVAAAGGGAGGNNNGSSNLSESGNENGGEGSVSARSIEDTNLRILRRRGFRRQQGGEAENENIEESSANECTCRYANYELASHSKGAASKEGGGGSGGKGGSTTTSPTAAATLEPTATPAPTAATDGPPARE